MMFRTRDMLKKINAIEDISKKISLFKNKKYKIILNFKLKEGMFESRFKKGLDKMQKLGHIKDGADLSLITSFEVPKNDIYFKVYRQFSKKALSIVIDEFQKKDFDGLNVRIAKSMSELTKVTFKQIDSFWNIECIYEGGYSYE